MKLSWAAILLFCTAAFASVSVNAQPGRFPEPPRDDTSKALLDTLEKMRIEEAKKDHEEMLKRGEDAVRLATDLEELVASNGRVTEREMSKIAEVEKLVKKIRSDLGGRDDDDDSTEDDPDQPRPSNAKDAVGALRRSVSSLCDELKKASRFTVSASAIQTTNAILRVARFLRIVN